jgi:hypothetical protein
MTTAARRPRMLQPPDDMRLTYDQPSSSPRGGFQAEDNGDAGHQIDAADFPHNKAVTFPVSLILNLERERARASRLCRRRR